MKLKTLNNKYVLTYPLLSLGLVLGSCSQEDNGIIPEISSQNKTITFTANPVTAETKDISTRVTVESTGRYFDNLKWEDDDKVTLYFLSESFREAIRTFTVSVDGSATSITGGYPSAVDEYKIRALYPHNASNFTGSATYLTIPAEQTYKDDHSHLSDFIFMYARPEGTVRVDAESNATGGNIALDFELLTSLLRFDITNESSSAVILQSVTVSYPEGSGTSFNTSVTLDEENSTVSSRASSYTSQSMTLNFSDIELTEEATLNCFMSLFPTESAPVLNIDLNILLSDNKFLSIQYVINEIQSLEAGARYSIPLIIMDSDIPGPSFDADYLEYDGYLYTPNEYLAPTVDEYVTFNNTIYHRNNQLYDLSTLCPPGYSLLMDTDLPDNSTDVIRFLTNISYPKSGIYDNGLHIEFDGWFIPSVHVTVLWRGMPVDGSGFHNGWGLTVGYYVPLKCRRPI